MRRVDGARVTRCAEPQRGGAASARRQAGTAVYTECLRRGRCYRRRCTSVGRRPAVLGPSSRPPYVYPASRMPTTRTLRRAAWSAARSAAALRPRRARGPWQRPAGYDHAAENRRPLRFLSSASSKVARRRRGRRLAADTLASNGASPLRARGGERSDFQRVRSSLGAEAADPGGRPQAGPRPPCATLPTRRLCGLVGGGRARGELFSWLRLGAP